MECETKENNKGLFLQKKIITIKRNNSGKNSGVKYEFMQDTMKLHCVYWTLHLITFISSGLLFLIVAAEGIPGPVFKIKNKHESVDNITVKDVAENNDVILETLDVLNSDIQPGLNDKTDVNKDSVSKDESIATTDDHHTNNLNVLRESVSQQPNLSRGDMSQGVIKNSGCPLQWAEDSTSLKIASPRHLIHAAALYVVVVAVFWCVPACLYNRISQTGQAVVLTLVDTATAELQNLAEPHLSSEARAPDSIRNLSQTSTNSVKIDSIVTIPASSISTVLLPTDDSNATSSNGINQIIEGIENESEEDVVVVVVESERKPITGLSKNSDDSIADENDKIVRSNEDSNKIHETVSSSGEFDNVAARSKLVSGSSGDETAAVILDGLVNSGTMEHHEDIPSFSEWAQKRLEEAEKKKTHPNASIQNPGGPGRGAGGMKMRSKNYASPDCGAKIVAVNPEARSARSVLVTTRDEYMLNTCTSRIWFVVELCEAIQAKKIELANFELFSSSPKDFSVFVNDRFPTRDWSLVGHFTAKDERDIQSFALHPHLFGKFIKIELHSHYGSEHFCPISLFRAYGTSEFEVLETETDVQETSNNDDNDGDDDDDDDDNDDDDDDDEEILDGDNGELSKNLFGSARDVVIRIVKKAAAVLVKTGNLDTNNITKIQESIEDNIKSSFANCMTPRYTILCNNCTDNHFAKVFHLISCQHAHLDSISKISFINYALYQTELCEVHGVSLNTSDINFHDGKKFLGKSGYAKNVPARFLASVLSSEYIVALCNGIATKERKLVLNSSNEAATSIFNDNVTSDDVVTSKCIVTDSTTKKPISVTCISDAANCRTTSNTFRETKRYLHDDSVIKEGAVNIAVKDTRSLNSMETFKATEILASQIKPTKTFSKEDHRKESSAPILEPSKDAAVETIQAEVVTTPSPLSNAATTTTKVIAEPSSIGTSIETLTQTIISQLNQIDNYESSGIDAVTMTPETDILKSEIDSGIRVGEKDEKLKEKDDENIKLTAQEQLSLESLLSDLKDLERDSHGQSNSASTVTPLTASTAPQQKESVFLRLSNRIKALEQNMSLSGQYLEELSRRYKKQVEEMQRSLERTTATLGEELKKSEERESKRLEEIAILRQELSYLSESMEILLYDRNNWKSKLSTFAQHIALIIIEIAVLVSIILYCRRSSDIEGVPISSEVTVKKELVRRKSAESMDRYSMTKNKKRRPSEIASNITGTYRDLMIDDKSELRKERKKKRKRESLIGLNTDIKKRDFSNEIITPKRTSSIGCRNARDIGANSSRYWPNSAPDCSHHWLERQVIEENSDANEINADSVTQDCLIVDEMDVNNDVSESVIGINHQHRLSIDIAEFKKEISRGDIQKNLGFLENAQLHSPLFMNTLRSRSQCNKSNGNEQHSEAIYFDSYDCHSRTSEGSRSGQDSSSSLIFLDSPKIDSHSNGETSTNGIMSDDTGSGNKTPIYGKRIKKEGGLKKMVRKLF